MTRILIVDDDATIRHMLRTMLVQAGFDDIVEAQGGREALQRVQAHCPTLVILDMFMPDGDGLEAIPALQQVCDTLPILAISGNALQHAGFDVLTIARRLGAAASLRKPFSMQELLDAVQVLLQFSQAHDTRSQETYRATEVRPQRAEDYAQLLIHSVKM